MIDINKAFELPKHGVLISQDGVNRVLISSDDAAPTHDAPIGSLHFQSNGDRWSKAYAGSGSDKWVLDGVGSPVVTQTADFGGKGRLRNAYLSRAGNVPSNIVGIPMVLSGGTLRTISVANEDTTTFSIAVYEHDGNELNETLLYTVAVTSDYKKTIGGLSIPVTSGKQLSAKVVSGSATNPGCTVALKGLSV